MLIIVRKTVSLEKIYRTAIQKLYKSLSTKLEGQKVNCLCLGRTKYALVNSFTAMFPVWFHRHLLKKCKVAQIINRQVMLVSFSPSLTIII